MRRLLLSIFSVLCFLGVHAQTANAGNDTTIYKNQDRPDTVILNGVSSTGTTFLWTQLSGKALTIQSPTSKVTYAIGHFDELLNSGLKFRLTVNGTLTDDVTVFTRDYQQKGVYPCRPGYDTLNKVGGLAFTLTPSSTTTSGARYNRAYINRDNVFGQQVMGGDTIWVPGRDVISFQLGDFGGNYGCPVWVLPKDAPVVMKFSAPYLAISDSNAMQHVIFDGTLLRSKGYPYGWIIDNSDRAVGSAGQNTAVGIVSDFTFKGMYRNNTGIFQIKLDAGGPTWGVTPNKGLFYDKFRNKKIVIDDIISYVNDAECFYLGDTKPEGGQNANPYGGVPGNDTIIVTNVICLRPGYDAIQVANARYSRVKYCLAASAGRFNVGSQRDGIFLGGGSSGRIDSCVVGEYHGQGFGVKGNAFSCFGYGVSTFQGNIADKANTGNSNTTSGSTGFYIEYLPQVLENYDTLSMQLYGNLVNQTENADKIRLDNNGTKLIQAAGLVQENHFFSAGGQTASQLVLNDPASTLTDNTVDNSDFSFTVDTVMLTPFAASPWAMKITQGGVQTTVTSMKDAVEWLWVRSGFLTPPPTEPPPADNNNFFRYQKFKKVRVKQG